MDRELFFRINAAEISESENKKTESENKISDSVFLGGLKAYSEALEACFLFVPLSFFTVSSVPISVFRKFLATRVYKVVWFRLPTQQKLWN